ncbi:hypothetical protein BDB00DRAFT_956181 [Zychaea mexicana]|uniref:uncharacterized protein n=1 Tax=Zychaea mexicana TaxID=64656 RepID=UPI0022FDE382|nr:uncharacterized protein BDB00DRAFT_956181 [Zychaea mexicana]KAI9494030.1 hypothetical protein BDB00DRAFT_956181 [Zychaea mexicana]
MMTDRVEEINQAIIAALHRCEENKAVDLQSVLYANQKHILQEVSEQDRSFDYKNVWLKRIRSQAEKLKISISEKQPSWKFVEEHTQGKSDSNEVAAIAPTSTSTSTPSSVPSSSTNPPTLKSKLSKADKDSALKLYEQLDPAKCWILEATKRRASAEDVEPWSVESQMKKFVETLNYIHPALSFILDVDDLNWAGYFNTEELEELRDFGDPIIREPPSDLKAKFAEMESLKSALEAYKFAQGIEHHPIEQPLLAWLFQTLITTAKFFIPGAKTNTKGFLETDRLYYLWSLVNTIYHNSGIEALGMEKTSISNAAALNCKRKLSAVEEIERERIGRRLDTIYTASDLEFGGLEAGANRDYTKEFHDSKLKLPMVLRDMLCAIVKHRSSILRKAHVLGYNVNGNGITMMDVDMPKGYVTRVRRTNELLYPTSSDDYTGRMLSLLELAAIGKAIVDDTLDLCTNARVGLSVSGAGSTLVPPSFVTTAAQNSPSTSSSKNSSKNKKNRTD